MEDNLLLKILEYVWIAVIAVMGWILRKLSLHDTNIKLLEQAKIQDKETRNEDVERNTADHNKIMSAITAHHSTVMGRLDVLAAKHK